MPRPTGQLLYVKNRQGLAEAFEDPMVRSTVEADLALADSYDPVIRELECRIEEEARVHDAATLDRLRTIPGVGRILGLTLLHEIHDITRFASVQRFSSYCRLVKPEHRSAGKRTGSGGAKIGNAHLKWAFSEAAVLLARQRPRPSASEEARASSRQGQSPQHSGRASRPRHLLHAQEPPGLRHGALLRTHLNIRGEEVGEPDV